MDFHDAIKFVSQSGTGSFGSDDVNKLNEVKTEGILMKIRVLEVDNQAIFH